MFRPEFAVNGDGKNPTFFIRFAQSKRFDDALQLICVLEKRQRIIDVRSRLIGHLFVLATRVLEGHTLQLRERTPATAS